MRPQFFGSGIGVDQRREGLRQRQAADHPPADLLGEILPTSPRPLRRSKPDIPLPEDWRPDEKHLALAEELRLTDERVYREADAMRDWSASEGATSRDWDARFRNWLRRVRPDSKSQIRPGRPSATDLALDLVARRKELLQ